MTNNPQPSSKEIPIVSENKKVNTAGATSMVRSLYAVRFCILNRSEYICSEWLTDTIVATHMLAVRGRLSVIGVESLFY